MTVLELPQDPAGEAEPVLRTLGPFELLEELGRGGMGVVYRARQRSLNREVAVKLLRGTRITEAEAIRRFRTEALAVARLSHPNIVPVYESGETDGEHYLAMGLVLGANLADVTRDGPIAPRRAAALVAKVAQAIQHAHEQGVLHRDLKPANVLVDCHDEPHVTDFGLARQFDTESSMTQPGQILGTPAYMAPEQARGLARIGPGVDVYSLGALLFHLLTGRAPFVGESIQEILCHVEEQEPVSPRTLNPVVAPDLASVCLRCLEKEPSRRYPDAAGLAEELERFLCGKPTVARPIGPLERGLRWCRREPVVATLAVSAVVLLIAVALVSSLAAVREFRARETVVAAERKARERLTESLISVARFERISAKLGARDRALEAIHEALRNGATAADRRLLRDEAASCLLLTDLTKIREQEATVPSTRPFYLRDGVACVFGSNGLFQVQTAEGRRFAAEAKLPLGLPLLSPDGRWMAIAEGPSVHPARGPASPGATGAATAVATHSLPSIELRGRLPFPRPTARAEARSSTNASGASIALWSLSDGRLLRRHPGEFVHFSQDSRWAILFDATDRGGLVVDLAAGTSKPVPGAIFLAATSPDGRWAALAQKQGISIWQLPEWRLEHWIPEIPTSDPGGDLQFSFDSATLAVALWDDRADEDGLSVLRLVSLRDYGVTTPALPAEARSTAWGHPAIPDPPSRIEDVVRLNWLRDGTLLLRGLPGVLRLDTVSGRGYLPCGTGVTNGFLGSSGVAGLALNAAETRAAVVGSRGLELWNWSANVRLGAWPGVHATDVRWEADELVLVREEGRDANLTETWHKASSPDVLDGYPHRPAAFESLCVDPDQGESWLWMGPEGQVFRQGIREPEPRLLGRLDGRAYPVTWAWNGRTGVQAAGHAIRLLQIERNAGGPDRCVSRELERREDENYSVWTSISADGRWVVTASLPRPPTDENVAPIRVVEIATGRTIREFPVRARPLPTWHLAPDGAWLLLQGEDLQVWSVADGTQLARLPLLGSVRSATRLSRDGRWVAGERDGTIRLVDTRVWKIVREWSTAEYSQFGWSLDFSPDSRGLVFQSAKHQVDLVSLTSLEREASIQFPESIEFGNIEFGPASRRLYLAGSEVTYGLDLDLLRATLRDLDLDWK